MQVARQQAVDETSLAATVEEPATYRIFRYASLILPAYAMRRYRNLVHPALFSMPPDQSEPYYQFRLAPRSQTNVSIN